jgi:ornithine carbamoyltransferase
MWQKFTERARRAVFFAQEEAAKYGWNDVATEHLLIGLVRESDSIAIRALERMSVDPRHLRVEVERRLPRGAGLPGGDMQLSPSAKDALDLAYQEARELDNSYIGTEHLLLGLLHEGKGLAARILTESGASLNDARRIVAAMQGVTIPKMVMQTVPSAATKVMNMNMSKTTNIDDSMRGRDLLSIRDLSLDEVKKIFAVAEELKAKSIAEQVANPILPGKTLAMIFEKPSLRTRVTFEVGMTHLGGNAINLLPADIQLGQRESIADAARNLERMVDGIMARTFAHSTVTELAKYAGIPVINGLTDLEHPCQALADYFTIYEKKGDLSAVKIAYIGDGCNTCNSLMLLTAKFGGTMIVGCPEGYEPDTALFTSAQREARETDASITITSDPYEAVANADVIYTDIWASMGLEAEAEKRALDFRPYQVNQQLVDAAKKDCIVMHCLPAHRGDEITDEVMDGPHSVVFDEAENRLHAQKAVMALLM